jgi:hypothetical protein
MEYGKRRLNQNSMKQKESQKQEVVSDLDSVADSVRSSPLKPLSKVSADIFGVLSQKRTNDNLFMQSQYKSGKQASQGSYVKMQVEEALRKL